MLRNHLPFFLSFFHICILYDLKVQVAIKKYVWLLSFYGVSESVVCICVAFNHHSPPPNSTWNDFLISTRVCVKICVIDTSHRAVLQTRGATTSRQVPGVMKERCAEFAGTIPVFFSFLLNRVTQFFVSISFWKKKNINHVQYAIRGLWRTTSIANYYW